MLWFNDLILTVTKPACPWTYICFALSAKNILQMKHCLVFDPELMAESCWASFHTVLAAAIGNYHNEGSSWITGVKQAISDAER